MSDATLLLHLFYSFAKVMYQSIFIDLDDTVWAFAENARDTFQDMYEQYHFGQHFRSFAHFYALYEAENTRLWAAYGEGRITKDELNERRFSYPLRQVGAYDEAVVRAYSAQFFQEIVYKQQVMPHVREALVYLASRYDLYILSNGFRELQERKMVSAGVDGYFKGIILSEDVGVHKPYPAIFQYALQVAGAEPASALMIGDSWENDVVGAYRAGWQQVYYAWRGLPLSLPFQPTYVMTDWREVKSFL